MNYFVKRGEQKLGPYSLADLQQRVATLSILPTDLAQSEGMTDWAPISQIIGNIPAPAPNPVGTVYGSGMGTVYGGPGAATAPGMAVDTVPLPPNLPWLVVLLMNVLARLWFGFILFSLTWTMILANWARKLDGNNSTLILVAMYPAGIVAAVFALIMNPGSNGAAISGLLIIGGVIAYIVGVFKIKAAMEEYYNSTENIGLKLSGVMTFFFSIVYLQYHINKIAKWKTTGVLS
ncbi:MAG TPA: DUF4339 domain-containing protein [Candidatus Angelobacter sp.]|jgi:hypothetical protein|nr:DUF4339 domain-containing protein [Candidatus Angelobacter sp.]